MLDLFKALADPCRLRLAAVLLRGEFTVQELTRIMGMGQSRISRHLKILTEAGVLSVKRQGTWSYYRAGEDNAFFGALRPALERELEHLPQRDADLAALAAVLEERRKRSLEFFDRHARQWDTLARTLLPVPDYLDRLLTLVPETRTLLEIGVGTGSLLPLLSTRASEVIGVDHSPAMLDEARRRLAANGQHGIELRLGEMTHLPLMDGGTGCVVANMVLHHAADPLAVLLEIARVLEPGGCLVLADLARHEREWAREQLADQWLGFEEEELRGWFRSAGMDKVVVNRVAAAAGQQDVVLVRGIKRNMQNQKTIKSSPTDDTEHTDKGRLTLKPLV
jgi:ubiquinone/menaquinone biosynthesis C-methylase UbiE/DNA-binding transcriptional ArsR family regulator